MSAPIIILVVCAVVGVVLYFYLTGGTTDPAKNDNAGGNEESGPGGDGTTQAANPDGDGTTQAANPDGEYAGEGILETNGSAEGYYKFEGMTYDCVDDECIGDWLPRMVNPFPECNSTVGCAGVVRQGEQYRLIGEFGEEDEGKLVQSGTEFTFFRKDT